MRNEDANELQITWEEAQELLRPSPSAKPTIVMVDNHEFEEYDVSIDPLRVYKLLKLILFQLEHVRSWFWYLYV